MSNTTPNQYRGFLVNLVDTSAHIWSAESAYTLQDELPANPATPAGYDLGVTAAGTFTEPQSIEIQTNRAGHIGQAGFVWREDNETDYYGADTAAAIAKWRTIVPGSTGSIERVLLDAVSNRDGSACFLYEQTTTSTKSIIAAHLSASQSLTARTIFSQTASAPALRGCLCVLEDGSLLAMYMQANNSEGKANVRTSRSYDGGLNWYEISKRALPLDFDIAGTFGAGNTGATIYKMSAAAARGEILLVLATYAHNTSLTYMEILEQYSSTDNGGNFVNIGNTGGNVSRYYHPVILSRANQFYLIAIESVDSAVIVEVENSTEPIAAARAFGRVEITNAQIAGSTSAGGGNYLDDGSIDAWIDENNRVYCAFYQNGGEGSSARFFILQSDNPMNALEWYYLGYRNTTANEPAQAQFFNSVDGDSRPNNIRCAGVRGTQYVFHDYITKTSAYDNGIHLFELGGYSTVNMPALVEYPADYNFANFDVNWVPYDAPDALAHWTKTGTGTITAAATHAQFDTIATQTAFVEGASFTTDARDEGVIVRFRCRSVASGEANRGRGAYIRTTTRQVSVYITTTHLYLYDEEARTQIASVAADSRANVEILIAVTENVRAWYRTSEDANKRWSELGNGSLQAGTNSTAIVRFGHLTALTLGADDMRTQWYEFHYSFGSRTGIQLAQGQENPEELVNKLYPPTGLTCYITGGTKISTYDGPAYQGETYTIAKDSQYPLRRTLFANSPTPRNTWRSANDGALQTLAFYWNAAAQDDANMHTGTDSIAIHLQNINFKEYVFEEYDKDTTSWVNQITVENSIDGQKNYARQGNSILCTDSTGIFLHENELMDCYFYMQIDGNPDIVRKIKSNTAGRLANTTGGSKRAVIILEDAEASDPTTITGYIIANKSTLIVHQKGSRSAAFRIKIAAQETNEGFFKIGTLTAGALHISQQYSRGRTQTFNPGSIEDETQDGTIRTRAAHKGYRTQRISWSEGIDTSALYDANPMPDYYEGTTATGGEAIAIPAATPSNVFGLARGDNNSTALVFLPVIQYSSASHEILNRYYDTMLCRLQGETSIEHVLGDENQGDLAGEVYRVATLSLREII